MASVRLHWRLVSPGLRVYRLRQWGRNLSSSSSPDVLLLEGDHCAGEEAERCPKNSSPLPQRRRDGACLPTVFLPKKLQEALDNLLSGQHHSAARDKVLSLHILGLFCTVG